MIFVQIDNNGKNLEYNFSGVRFLTWIKLKLANLISKPLSVFFCHVNIFPYRLLSD